MGKATQIREPGARARTRRAPSEPRPAPPATGADQPYVETATAADLPTLSPAELEALEAIQRRVLWLSTLMIHHANHVRPNPDDLKIGGHQASSASMVSILTALYFKHLEAGDRVSIKPHASPAYHAVQYLLGNLSQDYLTTLRAFGGLQAYPSRTKDPDPVDFSTGSVGLGAVAPAFAAVAHRYVRAHFGAATSRRFVAVVGDAELDEGNVWEAVAEEALQGLDNVVLVVDLNRQSLDRVIPGIRAAQTKALFHAAGWRVLEAKYGRHLQEAFARPGGPALRQRIDDMSNDEYQSLLRRRGADLRARLIHPAGLDGPQDVQIAAALAETPDETLHDLLGNLGGHDLNELLRIFALADRGHSAPTVVFAYTVKGWGLPFAGDALNHSMMLSAEQVKALQRELGIPEGEEWAPFPAGSAPAAWCQASAARLQRSAGGPGGLVAAEAVPPQLDLAYPALLSTQEALGRLMPRLADLPEVGRRIVTVAPDVAISTHLSTWLSKVGVFAPAARPDYQSDMQRLLRWQPAPEGQHIELGISEMNLFMLLGALGLSYELCGQQLLPIGTVYDPFVCRGLDALIYALYGGAKMIFAGTPSGASLSPEGGAHQSTVTASLGIELPDLNFYEPAFAREVEWVVLDALRQCCDRTAGRSTYLRLSTKRIDQHLMEPALQRLGADDLRRQVLQGGYRIVEGRDLVPDATPDALVQIVTTGVMVAEAIAAAHRLADEGIAANVIHVTSPERLFTALRQARRRSRLDAAAPMDLGPLERLLPPHERRVPIVTVHDASAHSLAFLGSVYGAPTVPLGVDQFGQSGSLGDLYRYAGIGTDDVVGAAYLALEVGAESP
jgi:pyruvate dehydrogenase E1 component